MSKLAKEATKKLMGNILIEKPGWKPKTVKYRYFLRELKTKGWTPVAEKNKELKLDKNPY